jgi:MFS family permease
VERAHAGVLKDTRFLRYAATVVLWSVSVQAAVPFFNVYLVRDLGAPSSMVAALAMTGAVFGLFGQASIGRLLDIRGSRWMMAVAGVAISFLPWAWYFIDAPYQAAGINAAGGILWAAYLLASFNLLLTISPPGQQRYYVATYHTLVFLTMFAGPLLGGAIAGLWGIKAIFIFSGAGRMVAVLAFIALVQDVEQEKAAAGVLSARQMTADTWARMVQLGRRVRAQAGL